MPLLHNAVGLPHLERVNRDAMTVPTHLSHALARPDHAAARHLAGRCVIALGDSRLRQEVEALNRLDLRLYARARALFQQQLLDYGVHR